MAERLRSHAASIHVFNDIRAHTKERSDQIRQKILATGDFGQRLKLHSLLGIQLLRGGYSEEGLKEMLAVREQLRSPTIKADAASERTLDELIATAHLIRGEQDNCITQHNPESCILPIAGGGVHVSREGSEAAINELTQMLVRDGGDIKARWLLNIAAMTLGEYPDRVEEKWRIDPKCFASETSFPRFVNQAPVQHIDHRGLAGGVVLDDFDGDGRIDIMASAWGAADQIRMWKNTGDEQAGSFRDTSLSAGLEGVCGGLNLCQADYNNDGFVDVMVLRGAWFKEDGKVPNSLLRNNGDGTFDDVTEAAGVFSEHPTQVAVWGDFDNDGWLDLFIGNESTQQNPHPCELYRNNGDGSFTDVAVSLGLAHVGYVKGAAWGDYDNDGDLDLYVSNFSETNVLYRNENQGQSFSDVTAEAGVGQPENSFPTWFFDYDNDGWLDLFVAPFPGFEGDNLADIAADYLGLPSKGATPRLYRNEGNGSFVDKTADLRLDHPMLAMGANFGDLDNDGWLDFYIGTGEPSPATLVPNRMYRNDSGARFQNVTTAGGFGHLQKGHGIGFADMDNDGDQDIYAVMGGAYEGDIAHNAYFENPGNDNHWITLVLEGRETNRKGLGVRIRINVLENGEQRSIYQTVSSGGSFGASSLQQEIGLGQASAIKAITLFWPASGETQTLSGLQMDRRYVVREGAPRAVAMEILQAGEGRLQGAAATPSSSTVSSR